MMNAVYVAVDEGTGRIRIVGDCPPDTVEFVKPFLPGTVLKWLGYGVHEIDVHREYFDFEADAIANRPAMPVSVNKTTIAADGEDEAVITGIPAGTEFQIDDEQHISDGEPLHIVSSMPATYRVTVENFPYMPVALEIVAQ